MNWINLHTHFPLAPGQKGLVHHDVLLPFQPKPGQLYSAGLHPWKIDLAAKQADWLPQLEQLLQQTPVLAVGECGLDRSIQQPMEQQIAYFLPQVQLAERYQLPLILHAVRSYSDLLQLKKARQPHTPWVLHGYQGNAQTTEQLMRQDFYFSFGTALLKDSAKLNASLKQVPLERLFLETDESMENIESIFNFAARLLQIPVAELQQQLDQNFQRLFG